MTNFTQGFAIQITDEEKKMWDEKCPVCGENPEAIGLDGIKPRLCPNGHRWTKGFNGDFFVSVDSPKPPDTVYVE